ncbi:MAG: polymerase subunit delta [Bacteroidota bacterium]|jgi:DNA polymerase-3 subunit delta
MTHTDILRDLKAKKYAPLYLLQGEEPFYIDSVCKYIEDHALTEAEKSFNQVTLYGKDTNWQSVQDNARQLPFMGERKLVLLKEAQSMKEIGELLRYCEKPVPSTILVICYKYGALDKRTKLAKSLTEKAVVLDSNRLYDNQLPDWISKYLQEKKLQTNIENAALIAESLGNDLSKIANELDKLSLNVASGSTITAEHIQEYIGISKDFNVFELQNALGKRDALKVHQITNYFIANPKDNPLVKLLGSLGTYFAKIYIATTKLNSSENDFMQALGVRFPKHAAEYKIAARNYPRLQTEYILSLLSEYDLKSKGVNRASSTTEGALLQELMIKILAA